MLKFSVYTKPEIPTDVNGKPHVLRGDIVTYTFHVLALLDA